MGDQLQPGAMGGASVRGQGGRGRRGRAGGRVAAFHTEEEPPALNPSSQADGAAGAVVADAVGQEIPDGPAQEKGVRLQGWEGLLRQIQVQGVSVRLAAVEKVSCCLAQEGGGRNRFPSQGLHGGVQAHGQVQVVDQLPDGLALPADDGGPPVLLRLQGGVPFQLAGMAHHQAEGGADIVGDAVDPVGTGGIPGLLFLVEPPPQHQGGEAQHCGQGQQGETSKPPGGQGEALVGEDDVMFPGAVFGAAHHQQPVRPNAGLDGVVVQIPADKGSHLGEGVLLRDVGRLAVGPEDPAVLADEHGPQVVLVQQLFLVKGVAAAGEVQPLGKLLCRDRPGSFQQAAHQGKAQETGRQHQDDENGGKGEHGRRFPQVSQLHGSSSRASRYPSPRTVNR